ncbi:MAG: hypothetical protein WDM70_09280 [Nitrosomonadales bacterium]
MITGGRLQRLREWLPLLPLLLLLGATYWLNQQVHPLALESDDRKRHDPDLIVSNLAATTLNDQGLYILFYLPRKWFIIPILTTPSWLIHA